jgi:3-deoxy-manno-octulosonate cytidylyltransferase (CMP-KDO synthetase)
VINVQGDEPFIHPEQIRELASAFGEDTQIASLMKKIHTLEELTDRNKVKVVADQGGRALYFSRSSVPFVRGANENEWLNQAEFFKHVGIYGYRPHILHEIVRLSETPLEKAESLEQLRWIEHGYRILMKVTSFESIAIDSPADLLKLTNKD